MYQAILTYRDEKTVTVPLTADSYRGGVRLTLPEVDCEGLLTVAFPPYHGEIREGDEGYFVIPQSTQDEDCMLTRFAGHRDGDSYVGYTPFFQMFGVRHEKKSYLAAFTGFVYNCHIVAEKKDGCYYIYPHFVLSKGRVPYEPLSVTYYELSYAEADYSGIARAYRHYLLTYGGCRAIADRENEILRYAKESMYVRVRMGWKEVPSPIAEQTAENEPPMHVACDFDRVGELMDAFHARGIDKAEFCLVGWNISGHDGRWPQALPVDERLGGEKKLRDLIAHAKELGYHITCHTNSGDAYSISEGFTEDWLQRDEKGNTVATEGWFWAGGRAYQLCPRKAWELAERILPQVAELGFYGLHYIDVIGLHPLKECYAPDHPLTYKDTREYYHGISALAKKLFGGYSSEGAREHFCDALDYALYITFHDYKDPDALHPFGDERIPLWQLVYHGIVLSNPYTATVNAPVKGREAELKLYEYGGRPSLYYYSRFVTEKEDNMINDWMGKADFVMTTDEELNATADLAARLYHEYKPMARLQSLFMDKHEKLSDTVCRVTYSDGTIVTVDYAAGTVEQDREG